jgi:hypothetical protein
MKRIKMLGITPEARAYLDFLYRVDKPGYHAVRELLRFIDQHPTGGTPVPYLSGVDNPKWKLVAVAVAKRVTLPEGTLVNCSAVHDEGIHPPTPVLAFVLHCVGEPPQYKGEEKPVATIVGIGVVLRQGKELVYRRRRG